MTGSDFGATVSVRRQRAESFNKQLYGVLMESANLES